MIARRLLLVDPARPTDRTEIAALLFFLAAVALGLLPVLLVPLLVRVVVDQVLTLAATEWQPAVVALLAASMLVAGLLGWLGGRILGLRAVRLATTRSAALAWHALRLPVPTVDAIGASGIAARGGMTQPWAFAVGVLLPWALIGNLVRIVVFSAALLLLDLRIGALALAVVAASVAASRTLLRGRLAAQRRADAERVRLTEETSRLVDAIETVKAAAAEGFVFDRWARRREALATEVAGLGAGSQRLAIVAPLTLAVGMAVVLGAGAFLVVDGSLTLGTLVAAQGFLVALLFPVGQAVYLGLLAARVRSQAAEIASITERALDPEVVVDTSAPVRPVPATPATLTLSGIVFGYAPDAPPFLDGLDLTVPAGSRVALVGGSGSGKSTVVRIAIGELVPRAGTVAIDGVARLQLPRAYRTASIAYVPQTPVIVPGTIRENLTLLEPAIDADAIADAVRDACIGSAIDARPLGLDEEVSAGGGFSGGELQRLAIARALVRRPRLLVLDEATSALDPLVEEELEANLRARGCTLLVVAHRLSTIRDADTIVVMDRGRIVQAGSYADLRTTGRFAELIHA